MRNRRILTFQIISIEICLLFQLILYLISTWFNKENIISIFTFINNGMWEHLKLVFFPILVVGGVKYIFMHKLANNYIESLALEIISGILFVLITSCAYVFIVGENILLVDIMIFGFSTCVAELSGYEIMKMKNFSNIITKFLSYLFITIMIILFIIFI